MVSNVSKSIKNKKKKNKSKSWKIIAKGLEDS